MRHSLVALSLAAAVAMVAGGAAQAPLTGTRHVYISVLDKQGAPLAGLTAADVSIKEDGASREIVTMEPASTPMQLVLLVDDTGPGLRFIRQGVGVFVEMLQGRAEMALVSTGGRNSLLVDFTRRADDLYQGIRMLTTRTTTGAYLLDGIREAVKVLVSREAARPVIVVVTLEGDEFSNIRPDRLLDELQASRAALHVVTLGKPTLKTMTSWNELPSQAQRENLDENINRKKVLQDGSRRSGGRFEQILTDVGIPSTLRALAGELLSQYVVVYRRPETAGPKKISVSVSRPGARVRAPAMR